MDSLYFFVKSLDVSQIHYLYHRFTINSLSFLQIHYESIIFFVDSLWFFYLFGEFSMNSIFFREFTMNSLPFSFIHYEFNWCVANILWIHLEYISFMNSLLIHLLFYEFTIYFTNMSLMCFPYSLISVSCWGAIIFWSDCICFVHSLSFLTKLSAKFITCCTLIKCLFPNSVVITHTSKSQWPIWNESWIMSHIL